MPPRTVICFEDNENNNKHFRLDIGNFCEYSHVPDISRNLESLTYNLPLILIVWDESIFIQILAVGSVKRFCPQQCVSAGQSHPR